MYILNKLNQMIQCFKAFKAPHAGDTCWSNRHLQQSDLDKTRGYCFYVIYQILMPVFFLVRVSAKQTI